MIHALCSQEILLATENLSKYEPNYQSIVFTVQLKFHIQENLNIKLKFDFFAIYKAIYCHHKALSVHNH